MRHTVLVRLTCLCLVLLLFSLGLPSWLPTPARAQTYDPTFPASVYEAQINPADNSLWVYWQRPLLSSFVSHFDTDGKLIKVYTLPPDRMFGNLVFSYNSPRFYYATEVGRYNITFEKFYYFDFATGQKVAITSNFPLPQCGPFSGYLSVARPNRLVTNPVSKHSYFPCSDKTSLVIDETGSRFMGVLPYFVLAANPVNNKIYTANQLPPTGANLPPRFEIITLTAATEQRAEVFSLADFGSQAFIRSVLVNTRSGTVYINISPSCVGNCAPAVRMILDKNGQRLASPTLPPILRDRLLNEATSQVYSVRTYIPLAEYLALDLSGANQEQLASFSWTAQAIDQVRNLVYVTTPENRNVNETYRPGLTMFVMDGTNFNIVRYLTLDPPNQFLLDKARPLPAPPSDGRGYFFSETGHTVSALFYDYWRSHGGLAVFGYPITEEFYEEDKATRKELHVQYFERARFEYHFNPRGYDEVQLGLLGRDFCAQTGPVITGSYFSGETEPVPSGVRFKETGHTLSGKFLDYWQQNGGLGVFGLPITEPFREQNPTDGQTYIVQYFERHRFEYHSELAGTAGEVLLGLLGRQLLRAQGWPV